jgi:hypothetical protein
MRHSVTESTPITPNAHLLLADVADLELEVDRLRKQGRFVWHEARGVLKRIQSICAKAAGDVRPLAEISQGAEQLRIAGVGQRTPSASRRP